MDSKNIYPLNLIVLLLTLIGYTATATADIRYVSSINAKLLDKPSFKAELIKKLSKGTKLSISEKKGTWLKVKTDDATSGWVSKFLTNAKPPTDRASVLTGEKNNHIKNIHRRTSAITTAAAARGLASKASASTSDLPIDVKAVRYMESFTISDTELDKFAEPVQREK